MIAPFGVATAVVTVAIAGRTSDAAWLTGVPRGFALLSVSTDFTTAATLPSALMSCAVALEPSPSMNRPITADAARPPISFTTGVLALMLAGYPAGAAHC